MKTINVMNGPQNASSIILGCMRMPALSVQEAAGMIGISHRIINRILTMAGWTDGPEDLCMQDFFLHVQVIHNTCRGDEQPIISVHSHIITGIFLRIRGMTDPHRHFCPVRKADFRGNQRVFQAESFLGSLPVCPVFGQHILKVQAGSCFCKDACKALIHLPCFRTVLRYKHHFTVRLLLNGPGFLPLPGYGQPLQFLRFALRYEAADRLPLLRQFHLRAPAQKQSRRHAGNQQHGTHQYSGQPSPLPLLMFLSFHSLHA